jgi:hypothetical protein
MADPNVTERCPRGFRCESCAVACDELEVVAIAVLGATMCLTLCPKCRQSGRPPQIQLSTAQKLVEQHSQHLAGFDTHYPRR